MLAQFWSCLVHCSQIYVSKVANSNDSDTCADFEDEKTSFENLIYQLFEFILVLKEKGKYKPIVRKAVDELCYLEYTQKLRASNDHGWWKVHEACLLAIIAIKDGLE